MNLKNIIFFFLAAALSLTGCKKNELPKGVLDKAQMTSMLVEVYLAEARLTSYPITNDSSFRLYKPFEESLFRKMGISDSTVSKSYRYYFEHPRELEAIYDAVIDSLSLREQKTRTSPSK